MNWKNVRYTAGVIYVMAVLSVEIMICPFVTMGGFALIGQPGKDTSFWVNYLFGFSLLSYPLVIAVSVVLVIRRYCHYPSIRYDYLLPALYLFGLAAIIFFAVLINANRIYWFGE